MDPNGPGAAALNSLSATQRAFLRALPKAELHAHLNGSIPLSTLQELAAEYSKRPDLRGSLPSELVLSGIQRLQDGAVLTEISDFFALFPAIYSLTDNPNALRRVTRDVLNSFLGGDQPQCTYLELRTTPRESPPHMDRLQYLEVVLDEVERFSPDQAALVVSIDRRMSLETANACVDAAIRLLRAGRRVVGVDLCGDPLAGDVKSFVAAFAAAHQAGLGLTLHVAETPQNSATETASLLLLKPARIGHATFLDEKAKALILQDKVCIEICLTSNLLTKTVNSLNDHHVRYYLERDHPVAICTDDILPFRNSLLGEYALLLAAPPLGLGMAEERVAHIAQTSLGCAFVRT